jgi:nucleoporin NDC1
MRPKPPVKPPSPYRIFLTPALHRRFVRACLWSYCASGIFAIFIEGSSLSTTVSLSAILTLCSPTWNYRASQNIHGFSASLHLLPSHILHSALRRSRYTIALGPEAKLIFTVGASTTASAFESFRNAALSVTPYTAAVLYIASSVLFGEISIWSASADARLSVVEKGGPSARAHLNERPLYYRSLFFVLALTQFFYHFGLDLDRIIFPFHKNNSPVGANPPFLNYKAAGALAAQSLGKSVFAGLVGTLGYRYVYRTTLWEWAFTSLDYLYSFPKHSYNRRNYHFDISGLFLKFVVAGFMLSFLWDFTNTTFSYYIVEPPLKKGNPITDDSKDPNGSLLNGLKDKRVHRKVSNHCSS